MADHPDNKPVRSEGRSRSEAQTRSEVESRLKSNSERMSRRIERIESAIPGRNVSLAGLARKATSWKMGAVVGAGLVAGFLLFRKRSCKIDYDDGLERLSRDLADELSREIRRSDNIDEAVRKAVHNRPPLMNSSSDRGVMGEAIGVLLRSAAGLLAREGAEWLSAWLKRPDEEEDPSGLDEA